jgi:Nif-specific regulatory protein
MLIEVLDVLERELDMQRGTIMLLEPDGTQLRVEAARNIGDEQAGEYSYRVGEGITGKVLETGEPSIIPRISEEPEFRDRIHQRKRTITHELSFICVPIVLGNEVLGTLSADMIYDKAATLEDKQQMLSVVAGMIANDAKARRTARLERQRLEEENLRLRDQLCEQLRPENLIGNSHVMRDIYIRINQVAHTDTTVLIRGESGTGKELVASAIHFGGGQNKKPFIKVNCAALNENLFESELFGHEKGAFTGASSLRIGRIEEAKGGTLFLDEIGEFSPSIQIKLLRVLQEREFSRVGSNQILRADVRIIAATNRDLEAAVEARVFRQDLYYRINVFQIYLPPLRSRKDDILPLAEFFLKKFSHRMHKEVRRISTSAINMMLIYHWPGNVRELENCIEHAVLLSTDGVIHGSNLPPTLQVATDSELSSQGLLHVRTSLLEREMITDALKHSSGSINAAAQELGITSRMVRYKIKKLGIDYHHYFKTATFSRQ